MQTSIATVCLSGTFREKVDAIAAAKFTGLEIFENDLISFNGTPAEARRMIEDLGLKTIAFQPFRDFEGLPEPQRSRAFARAERKFDVMDALGCDLLMVCSNVSPDSLGGIERAAADFRELGERAAARGMRVAFEALSWGLHINDYRDSWEVVRRADHAAVGLVLDSFHILARRTDLTAIRSIPKDRLFLVQIADAPRLALDFLSWSRHYRCFPGQGELPLDDFMLALNATEFEGPLSLEIFNDRFRAGSSRSVAIDGQRSLKAMLDDSMVNSPMPHGSRRLLPAKAKCAGLEFVEFAVDERSVAGFEKTLGALGFCKSGLHRSKQVARWQQGDINIVVNADPEGFAHSFNITHGTAVCALALLVDDANNAVARAVALLDEPFFQPVGPGETNVPAVRGLSGSLLYFIDRKSELQKLWEVDFRPLPTAEPRSDAGLLRIDHVAQSMFYEEMLSWLLFYTSLFDLRKTSVQTVLDPGGVVQSQAVESPSGAFRLILNASQSRNTLSSRFVAEQFGSGVQHIAFETGDIFTTMMRLRENGVQLLQIPENYYDDLEAKTGLPEAELDRLRGNQILYDRDGSAEYFHAYSSIFEGGFFFEFVERRDYAGYGAVNAPVRLAAQTASVPSPAIF